MNIQFLRLGTSLSVDASKVAVLEVLDKQLYTRVVKSLLSELGTSAIEPYAIWDESGKSISQKKALVIINTLPQVPYDNKVLIGKLHQHVASQLETNSELLVALEESSRSLRGGLESLTTGFWGTYSYELEWDPALFLKAFCFAPACNEEDSLLDNCIRYLELCADVGMDLPIVLVGAKDFFDSEDLNSLYDQAFFLGSKLVLLESNHDTAVFERERKTIIDQDFVVVE